MTQCRNFDVPPLLSLTATAPATPVATTATLFRRAGTVTDVRETVSYWLGQNPYVFITAFAVFMAAVVVGMFINHAISVMDNSTLDEWK
jgi:hypothetical protein